MTCAQELFAQHFLHLTHTFTPTESQKDLLAQAWRADGFVHEFPWSCPFAPQLRGGRDDALFAFELGLKVR